MEHKKTTGKAADINCSPVDGTAEPLKTNNNTRPANALACSSTAVKRLIDEAISECVEYLRLPDYKEYAMAFPEMRKIALEFEKIGSDYLMRCYFGRGRRGSVRVTAGDYQYADQQATKAGVRADMR